MGSHGIACDRVLSLSPGGLNSTCFHFHAGTSFWSKSIFCERCRSDPHEIACDRIQSHEIACDCMRSHAIAFNRMKSQTLCRQLSEFLKMHREREAGQKVCRKCFFTTTVNRFHIFFFRFLKKEEIRSGTHFTQQNVFLLFTIVVTKHVWPYFQSRFPKTSSERVSSWCQMRQ